MAHDDVSGPAQDIIWRPDTSALTRSNMARFLRRVRERTGRQIDTYQDLWRWSVGDLEGFWAAIWDEVGVAGAAMPRRVLASREMPGATWFEGARLNFAQHLLRGEPDAEAVVAVDEHGVKRHLTYEQLTSAAGAFQRALRRLGIRSGDRVVAYVPNIPEALVGLIGTAAQGAVWAVCSPEIAPAAAVDRFAQLGPRVLIAVTSYTYGGRKYERRHELDELVAGIPSLEHVIIIGDDVSANEIRWRETLAERGMPEFELVPFDHPLWVLFSSGTTGLPKGIVHSHGGILLEGYKQCALHMDLRPGDTFFWYTTTTWMMWNVVVTALLARARVVLYDGSAAYPDLLKLWRVASALDATFFGASAGYFAACTKTDGLPSDVGVGSIRTVGSTGSPLSPDTFRWLADVAVPGVPIASMSGGTDVCTSFLSFTPLLPVRVGELQCRALGVDAAAFDEGGREVIGKVGELVIRQPMPSMPVAFWNDPDGARYRDAYFSMYPDVWRHGDWVEFREDGGAVIQGRSDSTLNRGGIRMGSAEFYAVIESLSDVGDSLIVEAARGAHETALVMFVTLRDGAIPDDAFVARVNQELRARVSPRHVVDAVYALDAVPRTFTGKKLEVPVKRLLAGATLEDVAASGATVGFASLRAIAQARQQIRADLATRPPGFSGGRLAAAAPDAISTSPRSDT